MFSHREPYSSQPTVATGVQRPCRAPRCALGVNCLHPGLVAMGAQTAEGGRRTTPRYCRATVPRIRRIYHHVRRHSAIVAVMERSSRRRQRHLSSRASEWQAVRRFRIGRGWFPRSVPRLRVKRARRKPTPCKPATGELYSFSPRSHFFEHVRSRSFSARIGVEGKTRFESSRAECQLVLSQPNAAAHQFRCSWILPPD